MLGGIRKRLADRDFEILDRLPAQAMSADE
jgi:hypothetical protein